MTRNPSAAPGTLDGYLKSYIKRDTGGWVASLLQSAGVVDIDRTRPGRIRVTGSFGDYVTEGDQVVLVAPTDLRDEALAWSSLHVEPIEAAFTS